MNSNRVLSPFNIAQEEFTEQIRSKTDLVFTSFKENPKTEDVSIIKLQTFYIYLSPFPFCI